MAERTMRPNDQALTLRAMNRPAAGDGPGHATRVFSITSGKGGVGKTAVVANLAVLLARMGKRVLILDADLGLAVTRLDPAPTFDAGIALLGYAFPADIKPEAAKAEADLSMNSKLALKLGYQVRHNSDVSPGTDKTDQLITTNLVYNF